jgi:hypothetical protein
MAPKYAGDIQLDVRDSTPTVGKGIGRVPVTAENQASMRTREGSGTLMASRFAGTPQCASLQ